MPFFNSSQRYSATETIEPLSNTNTEDKMWPAPRGAETHDVNFTPSRSSGANFVQNWPSIPDQRQTQLPRQDGTPAGGYAGFGEGDGKSFAGYRRDGQQDYSSAGSKRSYDDSRSSEGYSDAHQQKRVKRDSGYAGRGESGVRGQEGYGYGYGYGWQPAPDYSHVNRQTGEYSDAYLNRQAGGLPYAHQLADSFIYQQASARPLNPGQRVQTFAQAAIPAYASQEPRERFNSYRPAGNCAYAQQPILLSAAPSSQGFQQQASYRQPQQYAHPHHQTALYPQQPYNQYGGYNQQAHTQLTRRWAAIVDKFPAPVEGAHIPNASKASKVVPQQPLKSVPTAELIKKGRIDIHSRYGQPPQQKMSDNAFKPVPLQYAEHDQQNTQGQQPPYRQQINTNGIPALPGFDPTFYNQYLPPIEDLQKLMPGWHKQNNKQNNKQMKPTFTTGLPIRTPPQSPRSPQTPRSAKGHLMLIKRPEPTKSYLGQARKVALTLDQPRPLLVVLDLNGTLLHRKHRGGSTFVARPHVPEFLHYLLTNHKVMVWSSARPENVKPMCDQLFTSEQLLQLVGVWARDKLRLSKEQYNEKVQCYKQLTWLWQDHVIASSSVEGREWGQENTVLIDDSMEKAASEPHNLVQIEDFEGKPDQMKTDVLGQVVAYLEKLKFERDASAYMQSEPFEYDSEAEFDWTPIINDMH